MPESFTPEQIGDALAGRVRLTIPYLYRDASNYKAAGNVTFNAPADAQWRNDLLATIVAACDSSHTGAPQFVPQDVNIDGLHDGLPGRYGGLTDDDHPWHDLLIEEQYILHRTIHELEGLPRLEDVADTFTAAARAGWPSQYTDLADLTGIDWNSDVDRDDHDT